MGPWGCPKVFSVVDQTESIWMEKGISESLPGGLLDPLLWALCVCGHGNSSLMLLVQVGALQMGITNGIEDSGVSRCCADIIHTYRGSCVCHIHMVTHGLHPAER